MGKENQGWQNKHVKSEKTSRSVQMGTSINKHPHACFQVRWRATENRWENTTDRQGCIWKRGIKTQLQWNKMKGLPSSYFPNKIWIWHVDHSENERSLDKERNMVLDEHKERGSRLSWVFIGSTNSASNELFFSFIETWKK